MKYNTMINITIKVFTIACFLVSSIDLFYLHLLCIRHCSDMGNASLNKTTSKCLAFMKSVCSTTEDLENEQTCSVYYGNRCYKDK